MVETQDHGGSCCGVAITVVALVAAMLVCPSRAAAAGYSLEVGSDQRVSVSGSAPSLKELIVELCDKAEVELLAFGADDRPISLNYQDLELPELLARLLRSENYMVGLRGRAGVEGVRIAWLRVMGENDSGSVSAPRSAPARAAAAAASRVRPNASPGFIVDMFAVSGDAARREQMLRSVKALLEGNSEEKKAFLRADPGALARRLAGYPGAREMMAKLRGGRYDYVVNVRLGMLADALDRAITAQENNP